MPLDGVLGLCKFLFSLSEFQCSHLAMGRSLAVFRDTLKLKDGPSVMQPLRDTWRVEAAAAFAALVSGTHSVFDEHTISFFMAGCIPGEHSYHVGRKQG